MPPRPAPRRSSSTSRPSSASRGRSRHPNTDRLILTGVVAAWSLLLTWIFWWPLWQGGGLVGGDLYPYYMPQKSYLAQSLQEGILPLWNALVGFGYPVLGESQTAALYPPNLILFRLLDVNTAYNLSQLGHYLLAFWGAFLLGRRWGLEAPGALLAATAFIYGWFPARICLEWSIIGGAWFVWILWGATAFLQRGRLTDLLLVALFLGMDLLAGHYNLAFITLLTLLPFPWLVSPQSAPESESQSSSSAIPGRWRGGLLAGALGAGFLLAAVQLLPTWELKSLSQRQGHHDAFAPTYGHLPIQAISQLWFPWSWYGGEKTTDELLAGCQWGRVPTATNQAEAQLYLGLLTLTFALLGVLHPQFRREHQFQKPWGWLALAAVSLVLATGWPTAWLLWMPGLNFFRGPGRYSMTAALALALLGGAGLDAVLQRMVCMLHSRILITTGVLLITVVDLWSASRQYNLGIAPYLGRKVFYAVMLDGPPLKFLPESVLRKYFAQVGPNCRLYAPGANLPTLLGVSALPVYLGLGPEIYESPDLQFDWTELNPEEIQPQVDRLKKFGVTHLLLESPLSSPVWPVRSLGTWGDRLLGVALGKQTPFFLYELIDSPGRVSLEEKQGGTSRIRSIHIEPNRARIEVESPSGCRLILRDLDYPGWKLRSAEQKSVRIDELFRGVDLPPSGEVQTVEWVYQPWSVRVGAMLSVFTLLGLMIAAGWSATRSRAQQNSSPQ